jgi:hypothetical protein
MQKTAQDLAQVVFEKLAVSRWREAIYSGELNTPEAEKLKAYMGKDPTQYSEGLRQGTINRLADRHMSYDEHERFTPREHLRNIKNKYIPSGALPKNYSSTELVTGNVNVAHPEAKNLGYMGGLKDNPEHHKQLANLITGHEGRESDFSFKNLDHRANKLWNRSPRNEPIFTDTEAKNRMSPRDYAKTQLREDIARQEVISKFKRRHFKETSRDFAPTPKTLLPREERAATYKALQHASNMEYGYGAPRAEVMKNLENTVVKPLIRRGAHFDPAVLIDEARNARMMSPEVAKAMENVRKGTGEQSLVRSVTNTPVGADTYLPGKDAKSIANKVMDESSNRMKAHASKITGKVEENLTKLDPWVQRGRWAVDKLKRGVGLLKR